MAKAVPEMLHMAAKTGDLDRCKLYLAQGGDLNAEGSGGERALHTAAREGRLEVCKFLLENGADVGARNATQSTALHAGAIGSKKAAPEICALLIEHGAEIEAVNKNGETPLADAMRSGQAGVCVALLDAGADAHSMTSWSRTPLHSLAWSKRSDSEMRELLQHVSDAGFSTSVMPAKPSAAYTTPFQLSAELGNVVMAKACVEIMGEDVEQKTVNGRTLASLTEKVSVNNPSVGRWVRAAQAEQQTMRELAGESPSKPSFDGPRGLTLM